MFSKCTIAQIRLLYSFFFVIITTSGFWSLDIFITLQVLSIRNINPIFCEYV